MWCSDKHKHVQRLEVQTHGNLPMRGGDVLHTPAPVRPTELVFAAWVQAVGRALVFRL